MGDGRMAKRTSAVVQPDGAQPRIVRRTRPRPKPLYRPFSSSGLLALQPTIGNRAVAAVMAARESFQVDGEKGEKIKSPRKVAAISRDRGEGHERYTPKERPLIIPEAEPKRPLSQDEKLVLFARQQNRSLQKKWSTTEKDAVKFVEVATERIRSFGEDFNKGYGGVQYHLSQLQAEADRNAALTQLMVGAVLGAALGGLGPLLSATIRASFALQTLFSTGASMVAGHVAGSTEPGRRAEKIAAGVPAPAEMLTEGLGNLNGVLTDHMKIAHNANTYFQGRDVLLDKVSNHIYVAKRPIDETKDGRLYIRRALEGTAIDVELRTRLAERHRAVSRLLERYRSIPYRYETGMSAEQRRIWVSILAHPRKRLILAGIGHYLSGAEFRFVDQLKAFGLVTDSSSESWIQDAWTYAKHQKPIDDAYYAETLLA